MPIAQATGTNSEGFEDQVVGTDANGVRVDGGLVYTYQETGAGTAPSYTTTARADTGTKSYYVDYGAGAAAVKAPNFDIGGGFDLCAGTDEIDFSFNLDTLPTSTFDFSISNTDRSNDLGTGTTPFVALAIASAGQAILFGESNDNTQEQATAVDITIAPDTWYHARIVSDGGCTASNDDFHLYIEGGSQASETVIDDISGSFTSSGAFDTFCFGCATSGTPNWPDAWLDNLVVTDGTVPTIFPPGSRFCADPNLTDATGTGDSPNYGYTYRRGGGFVEDTHTQSSPYSSISMDDGFILTGDDQESTWDYMAKGLTTSTKAMHVKGQIEANVDATSSVFRFMFQTITSTDPGAASKGNGLNTGNFADHAEAQFVETSNHWQVSLWYVTAGGARTQVGAVVNHGTPNDPTLYNFYLSTLASTGPFMAVTDLNGATIITSNGTTTLNAPAFRTAFSGDDIWGQWFVGYGTGIIAGVNTHIDADTALNNNEDGSHNSTCLYDDYGSAVVTGSAGSSPVDGVPPPIEDSTEDDNPAHVDFGSLGANLLAGALLLINFVFMGVEKGAGNVAIAVIAIAALYLGYVVGWVPLGFLIMLMVLAVAALWFLPGLGGQSNQGGL